MWARNWGLLPRLRVWRITRYLKGGRGVGLEVTEVGPPTGKKVNGSLLRKAKQVFLLCHLFALKKCHDNFTLHGVKEGQSLDGRCLCLAGCVHVQWVKMLMLENCTHAPVANLSEAVLLC